MNSNSANVALIVVGVAMDTMQQIESQLVMRHYDGFMKKGRIRDAAAETGKASLKIILSEPPGSGKGTQASGWRPLRHSPHLHGRHAP